MSLAKNHLNHSARAEIGTAKAKLLRAAAHLFKEQGYERTTVRDLARAVGLQSGSIFHHFASKEEILYAIMEDTIISIYERLHIAAVSAETPRGRLRALIRCELESLLGDTSEGMAVLFYEWRCLSPERQASLLELREQYDRLWLDTLEECEQQGLLKGDPLVIRRLLSGALVWTITWYRRDGNLGLDELAEQIVVMAIQG